jgi:hypothetical protein
MDRRTMRACLLARLTALALAVLGQLFHAAPMASGQGAQAPPAGAISVSTRQHAFTIPFRIEPARTPEEQPSEVQLHVSTDQGATWAAADRVKPDQGNFVYRAPHDGEYWYAIRTVDQRGTVRPEGQLQAQLKVVVDTVAPRLDLTAARGAAGELVARWQAVDPHLKTSSFKLEYQADASGPWERVAVESPPSAMRHTSSGEATWWPRTGGGSSITVKAEITDSAGNPAVSQAIVKFDATPPASPGTSDTATNGPMQDSNTSLTANSPAANANSGITPSPTPNPRSGQTAQTPGGQSPRLAAQPVARKSRAGGPDSPLKFDILPAGQRPQMVNTRDFELEYDIESVGASGVGKVELWGTLDGGRTWKMFGVDADKQSPLPVRVEGEGIYGFRVHVIGGTGLGRQPPADGEAADVWIGVDLANPAGNVTAAEPSDDGRELVLTWDAADDSLDVRPISLFFSQSPQGPWTPIAAGLENSGSYTWRLDERAPAQVYVRMEIRDEAGNVAVADRTEPVSLDRKRPEGRIRNVRPVTTPIR